MDDIFLLEATLVFIKWLIPIVAVLSFTLFLKPKLFADLEKKLSKQLGGKKSKRKTITILEKENLLLQEALLRNNRVVGLFCFALTLIVILRLF
ncbi:hypothetical protein HQ550_05405 [bacterium]|nr:hypothetical protein [bacterium]